MNIEEEDRSYIKPILNIADYLNPEEDEAPIVGTQDRDDLVMSQE
jgi:hypothetical protein